MEPIRPTIYIEKHTEDATSGRPKLIGPRYTSRLSSPPQPIYTTMNDTDDARPDRIAEFEHEEGYTQTRHAQEVYTTTRDTHRSQPYRTAVQDDAEQTHTRPQYPHSNYNTTEPYTSGSSQHQSVQDEERPPLLPRYKHSTEARSPYADEATIKGRLLDEGKEKKEKKKKPGPYDTYDMLEEDFLEELQADWDDMESLKGQRRRHDRAERDVANKKALEDDGVVGMARQLFWRVFEMGGITRASYRR